MMLFASANRDELVYENPNQFNINRLNYIKDFECTFSAL